MIIQDATERVPPELLAEASVWIARLHGDNRSREMEAGFRRWLAGNAAHARAFELATEAWEDSIHLRRLLHLKRPEQSAPRRVWLAAAAAIAVLAIGVAFLLWRTEGVVTGIGEQRFLTLDDGTRVYLNTATHIVVRYDERVRRVELRAGEALFSVAAQRDRPFIVSAAGREVRALGTAFVVRRDAHRLAVTLVEGKVSISKPSADRMETTESRAQSMPDPQSRGVTSSVPQSPIVTLRPGQRIVFASESAAPKLGETSLEQALAWRNGQVVLKDAPLNSATAEMNRYNKVPIVIEDPQSRELLINGLFQAGDSVSFAKAVAHIYGLTIVEQESRIVLRGEPTQNVQATQPR